MTVQKHANMLMQIYDLYNYERQHQTNIFEKEDISNYIY